MKSIFNPNVGVIFVFTILAMALVFLITVFVQKAKKKTGLCFTYILIGGIAIGIVGFSAKFIDNAFYYYLVLVFWFLIIGTLHVFLFDKLLEWPRSEAVGWRLLYTFACILAGTAVMLSFMQLTGYKLMPFYNLTAAFSFFIPFMLVYSFECYLAVPQKVFIQQKPWVYNKNTELQFRNDDVSNFFLVKYRLAAQTGGERIESLSMRCPGSIKLGDYFNSTLEVSKVKQNRYNIETRDRSNKNFGWFFFHADGSANGRMLDPNKTLLELGFTNPVYYGNSSSPEQIDEITRVAEHEGKSYIILCKREHEYKSQIM